MTCRRPASLLGLVALQACGVGGFSTPQVEELRVEEVEGPWSVSASGIDPDLAVDGSTGELLVSWIEEGDGEGRLLFSSSPDAGRSWMQAVEVARGPEIRGSGEASPLLMVGPGGTRALAWTTTVPIEGRQWPATDVLFARSEDGGRRWSGPVAVNDDAGGVPAEHSYHGAVWLGGDTVLVAWLDERDLHPVGPLQTTEPEPGSFTAVYARSADGGRSWEPTNTVLSGSACPCCRLSLAAAPGGPLAVWRHHLPGSVRDVVAARVTGSAAGRPDPVHRDGWVYPGCPHTGPALDVVDGVVHVVWFTGAEGGAGIRYSRGSVSPDGRLAFAGAGFLLSGEGMPRVHPSVAGRVGGGAWVVYDLDPESGESRLTVNRVGTGGEVDGQVTWSGNGVRVRYPRVVDGGGEGAWVAWSEPGSERSVVRVARIP